MQFLDAARILSENEISFGVEFLGCSGYLLEIDLNGYMIEAKSQGSDFNLDIHSQSSRGYFQASVPDSEFEGLIEQISKDDLKYPLELYFNSKVSKDRFWEIIEENKDLIAIVRAGYKVGFFENEINPDKLVAEILVGN